MPAIVRPVKFVIPALAVLGAAWVLVQPDTPEPATPRQDMAANVEDAPASAVELLGEVWRVEAPSPVVRPLTAAENAAAIAAMQRPAPPAEVETETLARIDPLRRPVPRPARPAPPRDTVVVVTPGRDVVAAMPDVVALRAAPAPPTVTRADTQTRWIVRRQGSGDVVAEVPLAEALAILTSR